jgi:hypothetical protein
MSRLAVAVGLCVSCVLVAFGAATAACVDGSPKPDVEFRNAVLVVVGKVTSKRESGPPAKGWYEGSTYAVRVTETLKGHAKPVIHLFSEHSSGRFEMEVGTVYLLFVTADRSEKRTVYYISNCGNSAPIADRSALLAQLRNSS